MLVLRNEQEASLLNEARTYVEYVLQTGLHAGAGSTYRAYRHSLAPVTASSMQRSLADPVS